MSTEVKTNISRKGDELKATLEGNGSTVSMDYNAKTGAYSVDSESSGEKTSLSHEGDVYRLIREMDGGKKTEVEINLGEGSYNVGISEIGKEKTHRKYGKRKKEKESADTATTQENNPLLKEVGNYFKKEGEYPLIKDIVDATKMCTGTLYNNIIVLEKSGLIERKKEEEDKRKVRIVLTEKGKETLGL